MERKKIHRAWVVLIASCSVSFFGMGLIMSTIGIYFPSLIRELGVTQAQVSGYMAFFTAGMFVGMPVVGNLVGKVNIRMMMTVCVFFASGGLLVNSFATGIGQLYLGGFLIGLGLALLPGIFNTIVLGNWFSKKFGLAMGISAMFSGIGGALFNPVIAMVIERAGWQMGYRTSALILAIVILPVIWIMIRFAPGENEKPYGAVEGSKQSATDTTSTLIGMTFKEAVRSRLFYLVLFGGMVLAIPGGLVQQVPSHFVSIGFPLTVAAGIMSGYSIGSSLGQGSLGTFLDLKPSLAIISYSILGSLSWLGIATSTNQMIITICAVACGLAQGIMTVGLPFINRKVFGGKEIGKIHSIIMMTVAVISAAGIVIVGAIYDLTGSFRIPFFAGAAAFFIGSLFLLSGFTIGTKRKLS